MEKIIIIGATSGIGKALAMHYLKKGHQVAITGRREQLLEEIRLRYPAQTIIRSFDISDCQNEEYLEGIIGELKGFDLLIFCSGVEYFNKDLKWKADEEAIDINIKGFVQIINYAYNYFRSAGAGHIAAISSIAAVRGGAASPMYYASKAFQAHYLESLTQKAFKEKLQVGITDIQPGFVDTAMAKGPGLFWVASPEKAARQIVQAIAVKKRKVYVTRRWQLIAYILKWLPFFLYKRI